MAYQIATITQHNAILQANGVCKKKEKVHFYSAISFYSTYYVKIAAVLLREDL